MKIALIYPWFLEARIHREEAAVVPLGLYYVAATLLANGHEVQVLNWSDTAISSKAIECWLAELKPDIIGFSIVHANRWGAIDIAAIAKATLPETTIVLGGIGATFLWHHLLANFPQIDIVVCGEGEQTFLNLVSALAQGQAPERLAGLPGLALRQAGKPVTTGPAAPIADLDVLADPARFFDFQHLALGRGCKGNCRFCGSPAFWGRTVRYHSAGYFVDQIERLYRRGQRFFFFSDDTFTLDRQRVIAVCRRIIDRGLAIAWQAISRVDAVDGELLYWMRRAGCIQISYGVESADPKIRRRLGKSFTDAQCVQAFALTTAYGILPRAYFIYGCPGESETTIDATLALIARLKPLAAIFYILDIFPGTALYRDFCKRSGADDTIWGQRIEDILYFQTDPALDAETVKAFGRRLREGFYRLLPAFADDIQLLDLPELHPCHADFLSRLALTFDQGDYAQIGAIGQPQDIAERLYRRALTYGPDARAFLGLGMMAQRQRRFDQSVELLEQGMAHFSADSQLAICLAVSHMNLGRFAKAEALLALYADDAEVAPLLAECRRARP